MAADPTLRSIPLNPLRAFAVAARRQNLTVAARELKVTQSAVSRHIAALEEHLGLTLFARERYGVALTPAGARYAERVACAFDEIEAATHQLIATTPPTPRHRRAPPDVSPP